MPAGKPVKPTPSKLDVVLRRLGKAGIRFHLSEVSKPRQYIPLGVFGFGAFILMDTWLRWISPTYAVSVPACGGNGYTNIVLGVLLIFSGLCGIAVTRNGVQEIVAGDTGLTILTRLDQRKHIAWYEIRDHLEVFKGLNVLRLKSGKFKCIPPFGLADQEKLRLLASVLHIEGLSLSPQQPSLNIAYQGVRQALVGPGIHFPVGDPRLHDMVRRSQKYITVTVCCTFILAMLGLYSDAGPSLGLIGPVVGYVAWVVLRRDPKAYDEVVLRLGRLEIKHFGAGEQSLSLDDIQSVRCYYDLHSAHVCCHDKEKSLTIAMDSASTALLSDLIKCAKSMDGLRVVAAQKAS